MNSESTQTRVALLIDIDNISGNLADDLFKKAAKYGDVIVRRGYGAFNTKGDRICGNWKKEIMHQYAITPVVNHAYAAGKNVADFALVIGAMELAYRKIVDVICIASNDSDFAPLAMHLRENGVKVYGFGTSIAPQSYVNSCNRFEHLSAGNIQPPYAPVTPDDMKDSDINNDEQPNQNCGSPPIQETKESRDDTISNGIIEIDDIKKMIEDGCDEYENENGWANLGTVKNYLIRINPAFSQKNYGKEKFSDFATSLGFKVSEDGMYIYKP